MPAGVVEIPFFADFAQLIQQSDAAAVSIEGFSGKVVTSARQAARAMAAYAQEQGATADEAEAAAARTAAAWDSTYGAMSRGAKDAGNAALSTSRLYKASADEQTAAFSKAAVAQKAAEDEQKAATETAVASAASIAEANEAAAARVATAQSKLSSIGKWTLFGGAVGIVASVKGAADLSQSMERLQTQAGASQQQVAKLTSGLMSMAGSVGDGPNELAQGMYHVVSNLNKTLAPAQRVTDELEALKTAAEGARVGGSDLVDTTNALGAAIRSGISGTQNYQKAMGALNATVGAGDMTMQNLSEALGTGLLGPMKSYGVSLKDISSALAVFGDNNIRGASAGTKLAAAIRIMAAPSDAASKALGAIGMSSLQMADDIRSHGLVDALQDLKTHLVDSGATASQQALVITRAFGGRQSTGVQILLQQLGTLRAAEKQVGDGANQFGAAWQQQSQQLSQEGADLKAMVESLADRFGMDLIPVLKTAGTDLGDVIVWFEKNKGAAEALGITIGSFLAVAVSVFVGEKVVAFGKGLQAMGTGAKKLGGLLLGVGTAAGDSATETQALTAAVQELTASLAAVSPEAAADATAIASMATAEDGATAGAARLVTANETAGLSFTRLLGPIGLAVAALEGYNLLASNPQAAGAKAVHGLQSASGQALSQGQLSGLMASTGAIGSTGMHGIYPWSEDDTSLIQAADKALKSFAGSGNQTLLDGITKRADALKKEWPQNASALNTLIGVMAKAKSEGATLLSSSSSGTRSTISPSATTTTAQQFTAWMERNAGLSKNAAAGVAANIGAGNAGWYGGQWQPGSPKGAATSGFGLAQWSTAASHQGLADMAKKMGDSISSIAVQEAYLKSTMSPGLIKQLNASASGAGASAIFGQQYGNQNSKTSAAQRAALLAALGLSAPVSPAAAQAAALTVQTTAITDQTTGASSEAQAQATVISDAQTLASQKLQAAGQKLSDSAAIVQAKFSEAATKIDDASTVSHDQAQIIVQGMADASQIQTDKFAETGLYGSQLIAAKLTVQEDILKMGFDKDEAVQQKIVDQVKAHWDGTIAADETKVATVTAHQDHLTALAQQKASQVQMTSDMKIADATAKENTVNLASDMRTALAQQAVTLAAGGSKTKQAAAAAALTLAQGLGGKETASASQAFGNVTNSANQAALNATGQYTQVSNEAANIIAAVNKKLTTDQGAAQLAESRENAKLETIQNRASIAEQRVLDQIAAAQDVSAVPRVIKPRSVNVDDGHHGSRGNAARGKSNGDVTFNTTINGRNQTDAEIAQAFYVKVRPKLR